MLKKFIHYIAARRHPWRHMEFDELAELYTSMTLRSLGFSLIGIFVPVYLYTQGVSLQDIFVFFGFFFAARIPISFLVGSIVGRIGPKHTIALSNMLFIVFLSLLLSFESIGWPLWLLALSFTTANGFFFIAHNTDFSKVKHAAHGGKELGWLVIFERAGGALGPLVGGLLAGFVAPQASMVFAIVAIFGSLIPLFMTNEPIKIHQKVDYKKFSPKKYARDYASFSAFNVVNVSNGWMWPLLIAVFIYIDGTYEKLGTLVAVSLAVSIVSARMFGKFIDAHKGVFLLRWGVFMQVFVNVARSATTTAGGAVAATLLAGPIDLGYRMPLSKGLYDAADSSGNRIAYLVWTEAVTAVAKALWCFSLAIACLWFNEIDVLRGSFLVLIVIGPIMLQQRFPALKND